MPNQTEKPFQQALEDLFAEHGLSNRILADRMQARYQWPSHSMISELRRGHVLPSGEYMERIAEVLGMEPEYFAEYRLLKVRNQLDPEIVGLKTALANLDRLSDCL